MDSNADRVIPKRLLTVGAAALALVTVPLFTRLSSGQLIWIATAQILITLCVATYMGPFFAVVATLFPVSGRYTGLSLSYNLASAVFGGTAPLLATVIMERSGSVLAPGWYVALCAVISLITLSTIRRKDRERTPVPTRGH